MGVLFREGDKMMGDEGKEGNVKIKVEGVEGEHNVHYIVDNITCPMCGKYCIATLDDDGSIVFECSCQQY